VLSGCNTGFGKLQSGEGLLSLARSFLYTGVRSIAYTLWPTPDRTSASLITEFYKEISHGRSLDNALQLAKKDILIRSDPAKSHPYFWSGYVLVGKTDPIQVDNILPFLLLLTTFIFLGAIGLWIYIRLIF
jgi:CHAT domain-containing protein